MTTTSIYPLSGAVHDIGVIFEGDPDAPPLQFADFRRVGDGFFSTLGVRHLAGRLFAGADRRKAPPVAVVNAAMARRCWPREEAVGQRVFFAGRWADVVGVVGDVQYFGLDNDARPTLYPPAAQMPSPRRVVILRTGAAPASFASALRHSLLHLDPRRPPRRHPDGELPPRPPRAAPGSGRGSERRVGPRPSCQPGGTRDFLLPWNQRLTRTLAP